MGSGFESQATHQKMHTVYALHNEDRDKIYIGRTTNLQKRMLRHNGVLPNKRTSYTQRNSGVWEVVYTEEIGDAREAGRREKQLKSYRGRKFIRTLIRK